MTIELETSIEAIGVAAGKLRTEIERVIVGHSEALTEIVTALFAGGHVILMGVPGLGKTLLVKTLSRCLSLDFARIQCTPDLMPADILGTTVIQEHGGVRELRFEQGPVFTNVLLADEINRATPKTQSALLEAMQESAVTAYGGSHPLPAPFLLLATENPIEMEGTYPLPEAQLDRFLFLTRLQSPGVADLTEVVKRTTGPDSPAPEPVLDAEQVLAARKLVRRVALADPVAEHAARIVHATHPDSAEAPEPVRRFLRYGASPRAAQALALSARAHALLHRRANVSFADIRRFARPALRHRLILNFEGEAEGIDPDEVVTAVLESVPKPRGES